MVKLEIVSDKPFVANIGRTTIDFVQQSGRMTIFFLVAFYRIFVFPFRIARILQQINFIGMKSMSVVVLTGLFTGMVLGIQGYYTLSKFGAEGVL
ncbi:MAG: ABC transporter permease, partial [Candidatus Sumerlaeota bacterium]